jgi:hypothetical protein
MNWLTFVRSIALGDLVPLAVAAVVIGLLVWWNFRKRK